MNLFGGSSINRIRLEFKVIPLGNIQILHLVLIESDWNLKSNDRDPYQHTSWSINRIRLEFKATGEPFSGNNASVLIESDWNLKLEYRLNIAASIAVLIESDWNLKFFHAPFK